MKPSHSVLNTWLRLVVALALASLLGCSGEDPTEVVVDNDYPAVPDGGDPSTEMTVYKVWWVTTFMPDAVGPGNEGQPERTVPNADFAFVVLAPGWDPQSTTPPSRFVAAKSAVSLSAARGVTLHVHVSDATFDGNCAAGKPLSQDDANLITQSLFPAEFVGVAYDAITCTVRPVSGAGAGDSAGMPDADASWDAEAENSRGAE